MELPVIMASLQLQDSDDSHTHDSKISVEGNSGPPASRLRKRSILNTQSGCVAKKKCTVQNMDVQTDKEIKNIYLNKKVKLKRTNLETIFEEPKESESGEQVTMSVVKHKRTLNFNVTTTKKKKRKNRIREMVLKRKLKVPKRSRKFSTDDVVAKLTDIING